MDWVKLAQHWPNNEVSRFVSVRGTRWHIQQMGQDAKTKPHIVLLHGAGATTHSYGDLLPELAKDFQVTALDLPGHGFTTMLGPGRPTLPNVAQGVGELLEKEGVTPALMVGHSAGAAVCVQMIAGGLINPAGLVSINGSFYPFTGAAQHMFPAIAKLLFLNPLAPRIVAASAKNPKRVLNLIDSTGSKLSDEKIAFYRHAFQSSKHVEGTLELMANWDLVPMEAMLRALDLPVLQIIGGNDGTVKPSASRRTAALLKHGQMLEFEGRGHLVHEEIPLDVADAIRGFYKTAEAAKA